MSGSSMEEVMACIETESEFMGLLPAPRPAFRNQEALILDTHMIETNMCIHRLHPLFRAPKHEYAYSWTSGMQYNMFRAGVRNMGTPQRRYVHPRAQQRSCHTCGSKNHVFWECPTRT